MRRTIAALLVFGVIGCGSEQDPASQVKTEEESTPAVAETMTDSSTPSEQETQETAANGDSDVDAILKQANEFLKIGSFSKAMDLISRSLASHPESPRLYRTRAVLYHKTGQPASAMADYSQAVRLDPDNAALRDEAGFYLFSVGDAKGGRVHLERAVDIDPKLAAAWNHLGLTMITRGELKEAVEAFTKAIELKPKYVDAFINRGFSKYRLKKFEEALADYDAALAIDDKAANAYNNRGLVYYDQQKYHEAAVAFTKCILLQPKSPKFYEHRRLAYLKLGKTDEARSDEARWKQLQRQHLVNLQIARQPANAIGYLARAEIAMEEVRAEDALVDFDRAIRLNPNLARAWYGRARARYAGEEYELAISDCTKAIELEPVQPVYSLRGDAYLKAGKIDQAIEDFHKAKRLDPVVAEAFLKKADELETLGQKDAAEEFRAKAKNLLPEETLTPSAN
jgi:tetratricopeptide (TPR) repeat protein